MAEEKFIINKQMIDSLEISVNGIDEKVINSFKKQMKKTQGKINLDNIINNFKLLLKNKNIPEKDIAFVENNIRQQMYAMITYHKKNDYNEKKYLSSNLYDQKDYKELWIEYIHKYSFAMFTLFAISLLMFSINLCGVDWNYAIYFNIVGFVLLLIILPLLSKLYHYKSFKEDAEIEIQETENKLYLFINKEQDNTITNTELRSEKLFKNHQVELKKYYDQTLNHSSYIFYVGILCLVIGFGVIGYSIYKANNVSFFNLNTNSQIISSILGAVSGILINYIGAIYLKMFSETIKSLTEIQKMLAMTHHLHFVNFITSKINTPETRENIFGEIAKTLTQKKFYYEVGGKEEETTK
jgi:hypothetical protein